jgi:hypothetical protein
MKRASLEAIVRVLHEANVRYLIAGGSLLQPTGRRLLDFDPTNS